MTAGAASVLLAALAGLLLDGGRSPALARLAHDRRQVGQVELPGWVARAVACLAAGAVVTGRGGAGAVLLALSLAVGLPAARRRRSARAQDAALARDLPRAADLTATCLEAGAAPAQALSLVADAVGGPLGGRLRAIAGALGSGAELHRLPALDDRDPLLAFLRSAARATGTGAPLADSLRDLARDERERARWHALERARRAGVQAVGPLAACFLPAFVLVGVVPVVVGVARSVLADW